MPAVATPTAPAPAPSAPAPKPAAPSPPPKASTPSTPETPVAPKETNDFSDAFADLDALDQGRKPARKEAPAKEDPKEKPARGAEAPDTDDTTSTDTEDQSAKPATEDGKVSPAAEQPPSQTRQSRPTPRGLRRTQKARQRGIRTATTATQIQGSRVRARARHRAEGS